MLKFGILQVFQIKFREFIKISSMVRVYIFIQMAHCIILFENIEDHLQIVQKKVHLFVSYPMLLFWCCMSVPTVIFSAAIGQI